MRRALALVALLLVPLGVHFSGCLPNGDTSQTDAGSLDADVVLPSYDAGGSVDGASSVDATVADAQGTDAGASDAGPSDAGSTGVDATDATDASLPPLDAGTANLRLVNLVPDLGQAIDVCAAPHGASLQGPFLKLGGVTAGLGYGQMTAYVTVPLVSYAHIRIVAANAADCSTALVPDFDDLPINVAQLATVALMGSTSDAGAHAPSLAAFADDPASGFPAEGARLRFVNAAPLSPPTDVVLGAGSYFEPEQVALPYGASSSAATTATGGYPTDPNGYITETQYTEQFTAKQGTDVTSFAARSTAPNGVPSGGISAFFTGLPGSATTPLAWVLCDDAATPSGYMVPCRTVSTPPSLSPFRVDHASPDLAPLDICFQLQGGTPTTTFGPFLQGLAVDGGLSYLQLTGDLGPIPTDTVLQMRYVPAGQSCAATPLAIVGNVYLFGEPGVSDQAIVLDEGPFGQHLSDTAYLPTSPATGQASLVFSFFDFDNENATSPFYDVSATADAGAPVLLGQPYALGGFNATLAPGTYALSVTEIDGGATTYSQSGMTFGANDLWLLSYVDTSATATTLVRCNLAQRDAGGVTACAQ